jgi:trigger factor
MNGFRPGKTPLGLVKKMYLKSVLADQLNKIAVNKMFEYIKENKIDILGQPLASTDEPEEINEGLDKYEFSFDLGLAPDFKLSVSSKDKLDKFFVEIDPKDVEDEIEMIQRNFGELSEAESTEEDDIIYAYATELNSNGDPLDGGIDKKEFSFSLKYVKDSKTKKAFTDKKVADVVKTDVNKLFSENETVISSSLGIPKEGVSDLNKDFSIEIKEIKRMNPAELNQELFDKVYGKDTVKTAEELKAKVSESLNRMNVDDAEKMLNTRIMFNMVEKHKLALPDGFLKRWLVKAKEEHYTPENVDEKYEKEKIALKWTLIKERVMEEQKIEVTEAQIDREAEIYLIGEYQRMGYGMPSPEMITEYKPQMMQNEGMVRSFHDAVADKMVLEYVKNTVTLKDKKLSKEKFGEKWQELQY